MLQHQFKAMGGPARLLVEHRDSKVENIALRRVLDELLRIERKFSFYIPLAKPPSSIMNGCNGIKHQHWRKRQPSILRPKHFTSATTKKVIIIISVLFAQINQPLYIKIAAQQISKNLITSSIINMQN